MTRSRLKPSCRCSRTAFSRSSKLYRRRFFGLRFSRTPVLLIVSASSMVTLLFVMECHPISRLAYVHDLVVSTTFSNDYLGRRAVKVGYSWVGGTWVTQYQQLFI